MKYEEIKNMNLTFINYIIERREALCVSARNHIYDSKKILRLNITV